MNHHKTMMLVLRGLCYYSTIKQIRSWTSTVISSTVRNKFGSVKATAGSCYGGDFAGLSALIDVEKGCVKKVPEHLLPQSFIEWEVLVCSLETLTSEEVLGEKIERIEMEVLPEAGCGVDNLSVLNSKSFISTEECTSSIWEDYGTEISSLLFKDKFGNLVLECVFLNMDQSDRLRSRVALSIAPDCTFLPKKNIKFVHERQTSPNSTKGKVAEGGGLDSRTVTNLIGPNIRSTQLFEDSSSFLSPDILNGDWKILNHKESNHDFNSTLSSSEDICSVSLPTGIIVRYWQLETIQYIEISSHINSAKRLFVTYALSKEGLVKVNQCLKEKEVVPVA